MGYYGSNEAAADSAGSDRFFFLPEWSVLLTGLFFFFSFRVLRTFGDSKIIFL